MTDAKCGFCRRSDEVEDVCGRLWEATTTRGDVAAHHKCMQYSSNLVQYKTKTFGGFKANRVLDEISRGKKMKCSICRSRYGRKGKNLSGATSGCAIHKCHKTFHFYCAATDSSAVHKRMEIIEESGRKHVEYRIFCGPEHLRLFERTVADVIQYVSHSEEEEAEEIAEVGCTSSPSSDKATNKRPASDFETETDSSEEEKQRDKASKRHHPDQCGDNGSQPKRQHTSSSSSEDGLRGGSSGSRFATGPCTGGQTSSSGGRNTQTMSGAGKIGCSQNDACVNGKVARTIGSVFPVVDVSNMNNNVHEDTQIPKHLLCIVGKQDKCVDDMPDSYLHQLASDLYNVPSQLVHILSFSNWSYKQSLLYMRTISSKLKNCDFEAVKKLICSASELNQLECKESGESEKEITRQLQHDIQENFVAAKVAFDMEVGRYYRGKNLKKSCVSFVLICDAVDPSCDIRASFYQPNRLYKWGQLTDVLSVANLPDTARHQFQTCEYQALHKWLVKKSSSYTMQDRYPRDPLMFSAAQEQSVCAKLYEQLNKNTSENGLGALTFIGPVDRDLVDQRLYVHRCLEHLLQETMADRTNMLCVFDIGAELRMVSTTDMMGRVPAEVAVRVWSGLDPNTAPVTCVIVEFEKTGQNIA